MVNHLLLGVRVKKKKDLVRPKMPTEKFPVRQVCKVCVDDSNQKGCNHQLCPSCVTSSDGHRLGCAMGGINPHHGCTQPQIVPFFTALGVNFCQGEYWARCVLSQARSGMALPIPFFKQSSHQHQ